LADVERPEIGVYDRVRVDEPGWPGALTSSESFSVLDAPPPPGTPWHVEEPPSVDMFYAWEGAEALAIEPWAEAGQRGAGVKVAVFDVQWFNAEELPEELGEAQSHDCEGTRSCDVPMDTLHPRYSWEEGSHGVACAEIVHDYAPDAELHLVRVNGPTTFENAVDWAIRNDIDVVSLSMSFFNNSFHDGSGVMNDTAARLADAGTLLVSSSGNYAQEHWSGEWRDLDNDGWLDFPWGSSYLPIHYNEGGGGADISWDEFSACGRNDFDVYAVNRDGELVGAAEDVQDVDGDHCAPVEHLSVHAETEDWYWLRIHRRRGAGAVKLALLAKGGSVYFQEPGGLADPASGSSTFTVGAVRADGYAHNGPEFFSSTGPTHAGAPKPDIAGPDGLSSLIYGSTGFYGTSASTPAVAATIALILGEDPDLTPRQAADRLAANTLDGGFTWTAPDGELGAGRARLWSLDDEDANGCAGGGAAAIVAPLLWWGSFRRRRGCRR